MLQSENEHRTAKRGCWYWSRRIILGVVTFVILVLLVGAGYQQWSMSQDQLRFPAPGELIDIGDLNLHILCRGEGSPTVIFEAGLGHNSLYWTHIQEAISTETRACVYDRVGSGWSDISPELPSSEFVATNLHLLLTEAGITDSLVLVGHSSGGLFVRQYAIQYPDDVVGMVLVDSTHENQIANMPPEIVALNQPSPILEICSVVARFGVLRAIGLGKTLLANEPLDDDAMQAMIASVNRTGYCAALLREQEAALIDSNQDAAPASLGDIPLIVLSHSRSSLDTPEVLPSNIPISVFEDMEATWLRLQGELAELSTNSDLRIVEDAGHMIQIDRSDAVIEAILDVLSQLDD